MSDEYRKAYLELFNEVTDVIEQLKNAQQKAETLFAEADDEEE